MSEIIANSLYNQEGYSFSTYVPPTQEYTTTSYTFPNTHDVHLYVNPASNIVISVNYTSTRPCVHYIQTSEDFNGSTVHLNAVNSEGTPTGISKFNVGGIWSNGVQLTTDSTYRIVSFNQNSSVIFKVN